MPADNHRAGSALSAHHGAAADCRSRVAAFVPLFSRVSQNERLSLNAVDTFRRKRARVVAIPDTGTGSHDNRAARIIRRSRPGCQRRAESPPPDDRELIYSRRWSREIAAQVQLPVAPRNLDAHRLAARTEQILGPESVESQSLPFTTVVIFTLAVITVS